MERGPVLAGPPVGRRVVLAMLAAAAAGVVWGRSVQDALHSVLPGSESGLGSLLPTAERFRIYSVAGFLPRISQGDYSLEVGGMVRRPLTLSYQDLLTLPQTSLLKDFQCVTGWRVRGVSWAGVRLGELLDRADVSPGARAVAFTSADGIYTESLTLNQARRSDVMVAYRMQDHQISAEHGGPVRLYVAPMYGYKSLKWLRRIDVRDRVEPGYWERQGYDVDGWIGRSNQRHDDPID